MDTNVDMDMDIDIDIDIDQSFEGSSVGMVTSIQFPSFQWCRDGLNIHLSRYTMIYSNIHINQRGTRIILKHRIRLILKHRG